MCSSDTHCGQIKGMKMKEKGSPLYLQIVRGAKWDIIEPIFRYEQNKVNTLKMSSLQFINKC